jgi:hypothetical protein
MSEPKRRCLGISLSVLMCDGTNAVDMLIDECQWNARRLGRVLDQSAKALSDWRNQWEAQRRRLPFDIVGSTEEVFTALAAQARMLCVVARRIEATAFHLHPLSKFTRQFGQSLLGAANRIDVSAGPTVFDDRLLQFIGRYNHLVICEGGHRDAVNLSGIPHHVSFGPSLK